MSEDTADAAGAPEATADRTHADAPEAPGDADYATVPAVAYWIAAGLLALGGLATLAGGAVVGLVVGEDLLAQAIAEGVASGDITVEGLTEAQLTTIATEVTAWLGVGLAVAGLGLLAGAVAVPLARRRQTAARGDRYRLVADGLLGAVATGVLSVVPASSILGGGVAGYANGGNRRQQTVAGAIAGLVAAAPIAVIWLFLAIGLALGAQAAGVGLLVVVVPVALLGLGAMVVYFVGLSALGGYVAKRLTEDD